MVLALAVSSAFSLTLNTMFYRPAEYILSQELPMFGIRFQEWPALLGGRSPSVSLLGISIWPIATPALLFLCSLGVLAVIDRFELRTGDAVRLASIPERSSRLAGFVFACFGLFGSIWLMPPLTASRWGVFIVFGVCCLIMGALYLYQMVAAERQARSAGIRLPAKTWLSFLFICVWTVPVPFALWRINARPGGIFPVLFWFLLGGLLLEGIHWYRWSRVDRFAATRIWGEDWQDFQTTLPRIGRGHFYRRHGCHRPDHGLCRRSGLCTLSPDSQPAVDRLVYLYGQIPRCDIASLAMGNDGDRDRRHSRRAGYHLPIPAFPAAIRRFRASILKSPVRWNPSSSSWWTITA